MIISETVFVNNCPIGRILMETVSQEVSFFPAITPSKLLMRDWASLDELRNAVTAAYQDKDQGNTS